MDFRINKQLFAILMCLCCTTAILAQNKTTKPKQGQTVAHGPKGVGTISHKYKKTGCSPVIVMVMGKKDTLILLPIPMKIDSALDVEGTQVTFTYRTLRIMQPKGCGCGMPARIWDLEKKPVKTKHKRKHLK